MTATTTERTPDRIEKQILLRAPRARVWKALTDSSEFGAWFGCALDGPFVAGAITTGKITDPPGYEHLVMELQVERIDEARGFAFRWHPYAIERGVDYSHEPTTLVEFVLEDRPDGTLLTISESGFERIPAHRRAEAFRMNAQGWAIQAERVQRHVGG
jgi:uncharacterized protein YndB with AHSA1/START domain